MSETPVRDEAAAAFERYLQTPGPQNLAPVVRLLHQEAWKIALRVTGNEEDAADVTQDLFLGLLLSPPRAGSVRAPRGYIAYRILTLAARRARSAARREKREVAAARRLASPGTSAADIEALRLGIDGLPDRMRAAVELHYLAGYTCREIAALTGVSERTVASDLAKGRESLRLRLGAGALGTLAFLSSRPALPQQQPPALLENLMTIAASGSALGPLVTSTSTVGVLLMKKVVIALAGAAMLAGAWVAVSLESRRHPAEGPPVAVRPGTRDGAAAAAPGGPPPAAIAPVPAATRGPPAAGPLAFLAVADEEGQPIAGAEAVLERETGEKTALRGEGGRFELPPPAPGPGDKLRVAAEGFFPEEAGLSDLAAGETRQVTLMAIQNLEVRALVEASRAPLPGCEVHVHRSLAHDGLIVGKDPSEVLVCDGSGETVVRDLRSTDKLHLFAVGEAAGLVSPVEEVKGPFANLILTLKPMEYVRGRVLDESRRPIAGADVWLYEASRTWEVDGRILRGFDHKWHLRSPHELDTTDGEGTFLLRWPAGQRPLIAARAEGHVAALRDLRPEELGGKIELVLERSALIEGVVLDEKGQPATSGATFAVAGDDLESPDPVKPWRLHYHDELKVPYRFVLRDIEYGSARWLIVEHRGKYRREVIPLDDDLRAGKRQVEIRLVPDPAKPVLIELAVKPFDRVTGSRPLDPYPRVSVFRLPSEEALPVHGNNEYGGFAWWCAVEPGEYRVEVATPGFLTVRETVAVREGSERRSESGCCAEQFRLEVPMDRDPSLRGQFDLPELLHLELLDRDRKPPPEDSDLAWQAFRLPGRTPAFDEIRGQLRQRDGAARLRKELKAGEYEVRIACEGFRERTLHATLPQDVPIIETILSPEWEDPDEAHAAIPGLVRKLRYDVDARQRAVRALVRIGPDAAPALMELLSDADLKVRAAAVFALGRMEVPHPRAVERIVPLLRDPAPSLRSSALHALGSLGPKAHAAIPAMTALLEDPIGSVRASAAAALGMLGPAAREAAAPLEHLLDDEDEGVRRQAKWALRQIAGEGESRP